MHNFKMRECNQSDMEAFGGAEEWPDGAAPVAAEWTAGFTDYYAVAGSNGISLVFDETEYMLFLSLPTQKFAEILLKGLANEPLGSAAAMAYLGFEMISGWKVRE